MQSTVDNTCMFNKLNYVHRLRSPYRGYTVDRRMLCTPHRKALKIKWAMPVVGKICSCRWASALSLQPMGSPLLCFFRRVTLTRGWHSAALACRPCWVSVILLTFPQHLLYPQSCAHVHETLVSAQNHGYTFWNGTTNLHNSMEQSCSWL